LGAIHDSAGEICLPVRTRKSQNGFGGCVANFTGTINRDLASSPDKSGNCREYIARFSPGNENAIFKRMHFIGISSGNLLREKVGARFIALVVPHRFICQKS
jgi:hypothetical protein